jgi:hypothetical protein
MLHLPAKLTLSGAVAATEMTNPHDLIQMLHYFPGAPSCEELRGVVLP